MELPRPSAVVMEQPSKLPTVARQALMLHLLTTPAGVPQEGGVRVESMGRCWGRWGAGHTRTCGWVVTLAEYRTRATATFPTGELRALHAASVR